MKYELDVVLEGAPAFGDAVNPDDRIDPEGNNEFVIWFS
jgi:hypothetical protein